MAAEKARLEAASARYEQWSATTAGTREAAGKAKAELQRRGHEPAPAETPRPQSTLDWWREFEASVEASNRALARQRAAIDASQPWPPARHRRAQPEAEHAPQPGSTVPEQPEVPVPEPDRHGERAARLDELQARANDAEARIEAQRAQLDASSEHTARMQREAQVEPEADWQAEAREEIEMEL